MVVRNSRNSVTGFFKEFQEFALKGNVVDLAVAVIIGGAFGKISTSFVEDVLMPLINPIIAMNGASKWQELVIAPGIQIDKFISNVVNFVIIAFVLFLVIQSFARLKWKKESPVADLSGRECPYCLETVLIAATKCRDCISESPLL